MPPPQRAIAWPLLVMVPALVTEPAMLLMLPMTISPVMVAPS